MITLQEIVAATGGKCDFSGNPDFTGINTDTRTIKNGELFIALKGENFDGHAYVIKAAENGAAGILASRKVDVEGIPVIYVKDTLKGYQDIAHAYRMKFPNLKVVAITGSNGKTSTKDMVAAVLSSRYNVVKTQANFNNENFIVPDNLSEFISVNKLVDLLDFDADNFMKIISSIV